MPAVNKLPAQAKETNFIACDLKPIGSKETHYLFGKNTVGNYIVKADWGFTAYSKNDIIEIYGVDPTCGSFERAGWTA
jgi:hypothetical protein